MTRWNATLVASVAALALAAAPAIAQPDKATQQQSGERGPTAGTAVPRGGGPSGGPGGGGPGGGGPGGGPSGIGSTSGSGSSMGQAGPSRGPTGSARRSNPGASQEARRAVPRSEGGTPRTSTVRGGVNSSPGADNNSGVYRQVPEYSRPRGNRPAVGNVVPRGDRSVRSGVGYPYYYYPYGYYPYGYGYPYYGSFGLGYFYYDPFWWGYPTYGGYGGYGGYGAYGGRLADVGALRLKVRPRHAQVFIDGYYVGVVDEFDGVFQRLRLNTGGHRLEIRADGYEPLIVDILVPPGETITYEGTLKIIQ